ncbi:MAG: PqqD family protein [Myxococcales bacterium]|nr:PqqD family protein [Myxococcales bacterium]
MIGETSAPRASVTVLLTQIPRVHPETAVSKVGGRWMAATPDERLHTFEDADGVVSEVGERIVELVDGCRSVGAIVEALVEEFEVGRDQAEADTLQFIGLLVQKQVLVV